MIRLLNSLTKTKSQTQPLKLSLYWNFSAKKYVLSQFPYPSGQLHLGHARVYYIGDTLSRYYKQHKYQVIYPIGFDSFGLPAENAAIVHGKNPKLWTENNISQMKGQLDCLNINFDWDRQISTHKSQYYKWTQLIFLEMLKKGLAYKAESEVNWDPVDKTVLANEQVDNLGRSWRSGALVERKMLSQWFFKISAYAEELQDSLSTLEWIDRVKSMQAGWIGFQKGFQLQIKVQKIDEEAIKNNNLSQRVQRLLKQPKITVFIKDQQWLNKDIMIRLNRQQKQIDNKSDQKQIKIGSAINPVNGKKIPIILSTQQNGITFEFILTQETNSKQNRPLEKSVNLNQVVKMRIKDWLISRQRYWGTPIPIINCPKCGVVPVPQNQLPVLLPQWKGDGNPLLSNDFKKCQCPQCKGPAERETDTMDTFVDSSWYYLRFLDPKNLGKLCEKKAADFWMPVDIYIGGIEHAIMHLLYARFIMRVLADLNVSQVKEPFKELIVQGLVKGKAIKHKITGKYLKPNQINTFPAEQLEQTYEKMSKSKFNGLNPQNLVEKYSSDSLRMALFFASPPEHDIDFHEDLLVSAERFLKRVQELVKTAKTTVYPTIINSQNLKKQIEKFSTEHRDQSFLLKRIILKLQHSIEKRHMHVYIANTMELFNQIKQIVKQKESNHELTQMLVKCLFVPVFSIIAPVKTKTLFNLKQEELGKFSWPKTQYFVNFKEYLIMKGNKLTKKGVLKMQKQTIEESQIRAQLGLDSSATIKNTKKSILVIIK